MEDPYTLHLFAPLDLEPLSLRGAHALGPTSAAYRSAYWFARMHSINGVDLTAQQAGECDRLGQPMRSAE